MILKFTFPLKMIIMHWKKFTSCNVMDPAWRMIINPANWTVTCILVFRVRQKKIICQILSYHTELNLKYFRTKNQNLTVSQVVEENNKNSTHISSKIKIHKFCTYYYKHLYHLDVELGYKFNVFEVFMFHCAPGGDSFAGVQAKHALKCNR